MPEAILRTKAQEHDDNQESVKRAVSNAYVDWPNVAGVGNSISHPAYCLLIILPSLV